MSLDVYLHNGDYDDDDGGTYDEIYWANITHNLSRMADEAGIYEIVWRPEEVNIATAGQLIALLETGIALLKSDPVRFNQYNAPNGWGMYKHFVPWLERYLEACKKNPDAQVRVSR